MCIFMFILGAIVGSFLNVCIVRMPHEKSVVTPRSHCVHCKKQLLWYDNIPFISYILLGGRCRFCKEKISPRYFLVELITAFTFVIFCQYFGLTALLPAYLAMVCGFIVATFVDFEHRIIPDEISIGGMFAGLLLSVFIPEMHDFSMSALLLGRLIMRIVLVIYFLVYIWDFFKNKKSFLEDWEVSVLIIGLFSLDMLISFFVSPSQKIATFLLSFDASIIGLLISGGLIYLMGRLGDFLFKKESMGGGDVKFMAMVGAFLGWQFAILTFFLAPFLGAVYGIIEKIRTGDAAIAYGPFLVAGALISLFWGDAIIRWILSGYGLY